MSQFFFGLTSHHPRITKFGTLVSWSPILWIILSFRCSNYVYIIKTTHKGSVYCCHSSFYSLWVAVTPKFTVFLMKKGGHQISCGDHAGGRGDLAKISFLAGGEGGPILSRAIFECSLMKKMVPSINRVVPRYIKKSSWLNHFGDTQEIKLTHQLRHLHWF